MGARNYQYLWALPITKQTDYNTVQADGVLTFSSLIGGPPVINREPVVIPDSSQFGSGHEWSEAQGIERWSLKIPIEADLNVFLAGLISAFGLGTEVAANLTGAFSHTCKPLDPASTLQQPAFSGIFSPISNTGIKKKIQSLIVSDFEISGSGVERLKIKANLEGSGIWANSTATMPASPTASQFLRMKDVKLEVGAFGGGLTDISSRLKAFNFKFDNANAGDTDGYVPNTAKDATTGAHFRSRHEIGERRKIDLSMDILQATDGTELDRLDVGTNLAVKITAEGEVISGANKATVIINCTDVRWKKVMPKYIDGRLGFGIEAEVHYDATGGVVTPVTITVINAQATHL